MGNERESTVATLPAIDRTPEVIAGVQSIILPEVATPAAVARFLNLSVRCVYSMLNRGELPGRRLRGRWFITKAALLEALRPEPTPAPRGPRMLPKPGGRP